MADSVSRSAGHAKAELSLSNPPPLVVLGMHRSGTSLITRMLSDCGIALGDESDLLPPNFDNTEGFWENTRFVEINDRLLAAFGGSWEAPPSLAEGWEDAPEVTELLVEAQDLVGTFKGRGQWGWKDPRTSLTLPFWLQLLPNLVCILCLRHPLEVADSLEARGATSQKVGLELWATYTRAAVAALAKRPQIVTHYDSYFHDPEAELRRVLDVVQASTDELRIVKAAGRVNAFARHHAADAELPPEVQELYATLCAAAGPVFEQAKVGAPPRDLSEDRPVESPAAPVVPACKYTKFDDSPESSHRLVVGLVPPESRVLEFGCATGYMSQVLRDERRSRVVGIELDAEAAEQARRYCERVIVADAEKLAIEAELADERFDVVLFADVLEHFSDPGAVLRRVRPLIKSGGYVVASIPNIAHASVRLALLEGEFRYRQHGLLDDTHLRFFTRATIEELFEANGYVVSDWHRRHVGLSDSEISAPSAPEEIRALLADDPDATTYQFVVRAIPSAATPRLIAMRALLNEARAELHELRDARYKLEQKQVELAADAHEYEEELAEVRVAYEAVVKRLLVERALMADRVDELAHAKALEDGAPLREEVRGLRENLDAIAADNKALRAIADEFQTALHGLQNSRSLRYTAPLRGILGRLRRRGA